MVLPNCLVVAVFWQITNSEWSVLWWVNLVFCLEWELAIGAIRLSVLVEATVLEYTCCVRLSFVKNQGSSSLIIEFPHILFALPSILSVKIFLLEGFVRRPSHEVNWGVPRTRMVVGELLLVQVLGVLDELVAAIRFEALRGDGSLAGITSQEVLARIFEFIANSVSLQLIKRIGRHRLASIYGKVSLFADLIFGSPRTLIIGTLISDSKWLRQREESLSWAG